MYFKAQEVRDRGSVYFGQNTISKNLIIANRKELLNGNGFVLGVSGSGKSFTAKEKSIIDRCTAQCCHEYIRGGCKGAAPTLQDFHAELLRQPEPEARDVALAIELFTEDNLNTFAKPFIPPPPKPAAFFRSLDRVGPFRRSTSMMYFSL